MCRIILSENNEKVFPVASSGRFPMEGTRRSPLTDYRLPFPDYRLPFPDLC
jgi:hypothetical protein